METVKILNSCWQIVIPSIIGFISLTMPSSSSFCVCSWFEELQKFILWARFTRTLRKDICLTFGFVFRNSSTIKCHFSESVIFIKDILLFAALYIFKHDFEHYFEAKVVDQTSWSGRESPEIDMLVPIWQFLHGLFWNVMLVPNRVLDKTILRICKMPPLMNPCFPQTYGRDKNSVSVDILPLDIYIYL